MSNYNPVITGATAGYAPSTVSNVWMVQEYLASRVSLEAAQKAILYNLIWNEGTIDRDTMTVHFRFEQPLTAVVQSATEGAALSLLAWNPGAVAGTAGINGFSIQLSKVLSGVSTDVLDSIARQAQTKLARDKEVAIAALFGLGTGGTINKTGSTFVYSDTVTVDANLDAQYANQEDFGPRVGAIHMNQFKQLKQSISTLNFGSAKVVIDGMDNDVIEAGATSYFKHGLVSSGNSGVDWVGGAFVRDALGCTQAQLPQIEVNPIPGAHTWSVDATEAFGISLLRPLFLVPIISSKTS